MRKRYLKVSFTMVVSLHLFTKSSGSKLNEIDECIFNPVWDFGLYYIICFIYRAVLEKASQMQLRGYLLYHRRLCKEDSKACILIFQTLLVIRKEILIFSNI